MRLPADNCEVLWFGEVVLYYLFIFFLVVWKPWSIVAGSLRFQTESRQSDIQPNLTSSPVSNGLFFIYFLFSPLNWNVIKAKKADPVCVSNPFVQLG